MSGYSSCYCYLINLPPDRDTDFDSDSHYTH